MLTVGVSGDGDGVDVCKLTRLIVEICPAVKAFPEGC